MNKTATEELARVKVMVESKQWTPLQAGSHLMSVGYAVNEPAVWAMGLEFYMSTLAKKRVD